MSSGGPKCITKQTLGQSTPIPNAIVAQTILRIPSGFVNESMICSFTSELVQLVYISTCLYLGKVGGAPEGTVKSLPNFL